MPHASGEQAPAAFAQRAFRMPTVSPAALSECEYLLFFLSLFHHYICGVYRYYNTRFNSQISSLRATSTADTETTEYPSEILSSELNTLNEWGFWIISFEHRE